VVSLRQSVDVSRLIYQLNWWCRLVASAGECRGGVLKKCELWQRECRWSPSRVPKVLRKVDLWQSGATFRRGKSGVGGRAARLTATGRISSAAGGPELPEAGFSQQLAAQPGKERIAGTVPVRASERAGGRALRNPGARVHQVRLRRALNSARPRTDWAAVCLASCLGYFAGTRCGQASRCVSLHVHWPASVRASNW
jgi:hypothetical protein